MKQYVCHNFNPIIFSTAGVCPPFHTPPPAYGFRSRRRPGHPPAAARRSVLGDERCRRRGAFAMSSAGVTQHRPSSYGGGGLFTSPQSHYPKAQQISEHYIFFFLRFGSFLLCEPSDISPPSPHGIEHIFTSQQQPHIRMLEEVQWKKITIPHVCRSRGARPPFVHAILWRPVAPSDRCPRPLRSPPHARESGGPARASPGPRLPSHATGGIR